MTTVPLPLRSSAAEGIYLARQSILDRSQELFAFELLFRASDQDSASFVDGTLATATVIQHALNEFGLESVLGRYRGFVNVDASMILSEMVELLPKDRVVLEVLETVELNKSVLARLEQLKRAGFMLALDDVVALPPNLGRVVALFDIVKVDIAALGLTPARALAATLTGLPVRLLAEKVDERAQVDACLALGFDYFQGYYFARPQLISGRRLSPADAVIMRLLTMLLADADTRDLEALLKQEPVLTVNLLRLTNSVGAGARHRITSVASAILVLGRRQLHRWLQLLLFAGNKASTPLPTPLMQLAATRGRLMELMAASWRDEGLADRAFMTGIMSLMEALLSTPIAEILAPLPVADEVAAALLERSGRLGAMLDVVEVIEGRDTRALIDVLGPLKPLSVNAVEEAHRAALAWANSIAI